MFHYSVSLYCFNPLLESGEISKRAAIRFARYAGFDGFEMLDLYWKDGEDRAKQADVVKIEAEEERMAIACYTVHNDLALFDEKPWRATLDRLLADVDLAARMETRSMRVESTFGPKAPHDKKTFEECLKPVARGLKEVAKRAASCGIRVGLENHGRFVGSSERVEAVIKAVDEPNFGACVDIGNFLVVDEDPVQAVTRLAPRAVHAHVKDMHFFETNPGAAFATNAGKYLRGAVLGEGVVDVAQCVEILAGAGYRGWLSLEFEGRENLFYGVAQGRANLGGILARLPLRG